MAGLPAVMEAKKAQLEAVHLEPIAVTKRPVPVVVNTEPKKEPEKKVEEVPAINEDDFAVGAEEKPTTVETKPEVKTEVKPEVKTEVKVVKPEEDEGNWKWMYKSLEGNHKLIVEENRSLRDKVVELETKFTLISEKSAPSKAVDVSTELTPDELEEYSGALPVLNKLLAKQQRYMEESVIKPLQTEIVELKKNTNDVAAKAAASDQGSFVQQVRMQVKDFDTILKTPQWVEFTNRPLSSYTDETIGQALWKAHTKRDLAKVVSVFEDFSKLNTSSAADAYRAPSVSSSSGVLPNDGKKPVLKWSKRKEASDKFIKRQISKAEYDAISKLYHDANLEGRIDFTK